MACVGHSQTCVPLWKVLNRHLFGPTVCHGVSAGSSGLWWVSERVLRKVAPTDLLAFDELPRNPLEFSMTTHTKLKIVATFLGLASMASFSDAAAVTHKVDFRGVLMGNSPDGDEFYLSQTIVNPYTSANVNFDVLVTLDWIDASGSTVSGITGTVFGNSQFLGANSRLGITQPDTGEVETVSSVNGPAMERLSFSIVNLPGDVVFTGYSNPYGYFDGDETISGTTDYSIAAGAGGYRLGSLDANFTIADPQAVPEPATWLSFSLVVGVALVAIVRRKRCQSSTIA